MKKYNEAKFMFTNKKHMNEKVFDEFDTFTRDSIAEYLAINYGSVYIYGGEPFSEINLLVTVLNKIRREGSRIRIETNGEYITDHFNDEDKKVKNILLNTDEVILRVDNASESFKEYYCINNYCTMNMQDCFKVFIRLHLKRCKLALKSVISTNNIDTYHLETKFRDIKNLKKIILERETKEEFAISVESFNDFTKNLIQEYPEIEFEIIDSKDAYYFSGNGYLYQHEKRLGYYNEKGIKLPDYDQSNVNIGIDHKKLKKILKLIRSKKTIFMDIEAVSRPYKYMKKFTGTNDLSVLWSLIQIDENYKIINRKIGFIQDYKERFDIHISFIDYILKNNIGCIVVSGGDLEKRFFKNCLVTIRKRLKDNEFRNLLYLEEKFVDIQDVIKMEAFWLHENKERIAIPIRSDDILRNLAHTYPNIIDNNGRTNDKASRQISIKLDEILFSGNYSEQEIKSHMQEIGDYCFDDIYQDLRLYRFYEMMDKYYFKNKSKKGKKV